MFWIKVVACIFFYVAIEETQSHVLNHCECGIGGNPFNTRIVGGSETKPHEYPWMAGIFNDGTVYCGGSVISTRHILTAAHCVHYTDPLQLKISLGMHTIGDATHKIYDVVGAMLHPKFYAFPTYDNYDVAIIEVSPTIVFNDFIRPICIPSLESNLVNAKARVAGWGRTTDGGSTSDKLLEAKVNLLSDHDCKSSLIGEFYDTDSMLCAYKTKKDACQGDSGGPLFLETSLNRFEQVGVTSFGIGCGSTIPGIYARLDSGIEWIHNVVSTADICYDSNMNSSSYNHRFRKLFITDN